MVSLMWAWIKTANQEVVTCKFFIHCSLLSKGHCKQINTTFMQNSALYLTTCSIQWYHCVPCICTFMEINKRHYHQWKMCKLLVAIFIIHLHQSCVIKWELLYCVPTSTIMWFNFSNFFLFLKLWEIYS